MLVRSYSIFYGDLETTVYEGQEATEAWSSAIIGETLKEPLLFHSLADTWKWIKSIPGNILIYYHNLKFDGCYWMDFFMRGKELKEGNKQDGDRIRLKLQKELYNREYTYNISHKGIWYNIIIKQHNRYIEFRDSLKLIPFKLAQVGKAFGTPHQKLEMEFAEKHPGYIPTPEEEAYIKNDVYVLQEGMEKMFNEGHTKMTIGSCCLAEFKRMVSKEDFGIFFPDIYQQPIDKKYFSTPIGFSASLGEYVLHSYRGAFCDVNPAYKGKLIEQPGYTLDVTSLYPSVMHSKSGNKYPVGYGKMWEGNSIPEEAQRDNRYYFVRFRCAFKIKPGKLPFVQIKDDWRYKGTEHLSTSAVYNPRDGKYYDYLESEGGELHKVTLTMCMDEYELFCENYYTEEFEILDGCYFNAEIGLFDQYIDRYFELKAQAKTKVERAIAKLFLNNLYGKFATSPDSSYKRLVMGEDNALHYVTVEEHNKPPGYIPVGSAITAKARCFTIRAAQCNLSVWCYADTDSIHCIGNPADAKGVVIAENELCTWKVESIWQTAYFTRQKTYLEVSDGKLSITCAGMPDRCKDLFAASCGYKKLSELKKLDDKEIEYLQQHKTLSDFRDGLRIPSKLYSKNIPGGTLLYKDFYEMR